MKKQIQLLRGAVILLALLTISSTTFADFVIKGNAKVKVLSGTSMTSNVDVSMSENAVLTNEGTVTLKGDFTNNVAGTSDLGPGDFILNGTATQTIAGSGESRLRSLYVNNSTGITVNGDIAVGYTLVMENGIVELGTGNLKMESAAFLATTGDAFGPTKFFATNGTGEFIQTYAAGTNLFGASEVFYLGTTNNGAEYTPLIISYTDGDVDPTDSVYFHARVSDSKHPNNNSYEHYLERYWVAEINGSIASLDYTASMIYLDADIAGTENNILQGLFQTPEWFVLGAANHGLNEMQFTGLDASGDFTGVEFLYIADMSIYLQGAYDSVTPSNKLMRTELRGVDFIPLTAEEAYPEYNGPEVVADFASVPANAVDWVMIELRLADVIGNATVASSIDTLAGFVLADGSVVSQDGISGLPMKTVVPGGQTLYIVIHHRNHIPVMSSAAPTAGLNGNITYDFTTGTSAVYGTNALVLVYADPGPGSDIYGLYAGDGNHDYIVTYGDKQPVDDLTNTPAAVGYLNADNNMDGLVNYGDKQLIDDNMKTALQLPY